ncbi:HAD-like protein [Rhizoclosmatium globosum]|uniref:HAD-like protein n=1 Tax=Rhizoclosmatium globosum TaxID=329046 RepID=A0A1Y2CF09_9FUNG|nr:HAD-like protein [Rhizoclosmatium globosum]|eukprot:ORY45640.1 HAD-like protein [Rhizoclosmatium globosum]
MILLAVLVLDYYAVFSRFNFRNESNLLFNDHELLSTVFILSWHFVLVWFLGLKTIQDRSESYFGKRVPINDATLVQVEKRVMDAVTIANMGAVAEWVRKIEAKARRFLKAEHSVTMVPVESTSGGRKYIEFECVRYVYDERAGRFQPYSFAVGPTYADLHKQSSGLSSNDARLREELCGPNKIAFPADTFGSALIKEFSGIFYIYQMMTLWIWYYYAYYYMGLVLTIVIISSGLSKVRVFLTAQRRVLSMANFTGVVRALRNREWVTLSTEDLVPGDVIEIKASEHVLPVDAVLVSGGAVCDESSLTGEALPVVKFPVKNDANMVYKRDDSSKSNSLFAGCFVLESQPAVKGQPVLAVVTATGATTSKGRLVKDILFPTKVSFVFQEHLKVVFMLLMIWGGIMLVLSIILLGTTGTDAWFYGMFTISQVLSPLLPAVLVIGQSVASERLAKKGILCVDLDRITLSGKVKVYCFDKTGTLTKEGLNFLGVQPVIPNSLKFGPVLNDFSQFPTPMRVAMLTCHSVTMVGGFPVGNFVDVEMFRTTEARLGKPGEDMDVPISDATVVHAASNGDGQLQILKRFEFVHSNAYMTVLMRDPVTGKMYAYLKGSFEKIREICDSASLPPDAESNARFHASEGCYVLGFARKELPSNITYTDAVNLTRMDLERGGIQFLGLCLFRNELKADTADALEELRDGGCRVVMITGDNMDTGVFVAKRCGMIRNNEFGEVLVVMGDVDPADKNRVVWKTGSNQIEYQDLTSKLAASRAGNYRPMELAVTGKAFNVLLNNGAMRNLLFDTRVFARMSPDDKVMCVRLHMEKAITAMCGDGGNDAGALKAAHSGIALSEAESSVVAHFSSRNRSIFSCVELLREARCALDISFASYKYLIMYGEVLAFIGLMQYYFNVNMAQAMWILVDGSTVPLSWALTQARPALRLARTRPTARLLGPETLISVIGMIVINVIFGIIAVAMLFGERYSNGGWFNCNEFASQFYDIRRWWELADNYEGQVTGIIIVFQIVHASAIFNIGRVYRSGFWKNWVFLSVYGAIITLLSFVTLADPNPLSCVFHINCGTSAALSRLNRDWGTNYSTSFLGVPSSYYSFSGHNVMPMQFRVRLWLLCMGNLLVLVLFQWGVVLNFGRSFAKKRWPQSRLMYKP